MSVVDLYTDASYAAHKTPSYFGIGIFLIDYSDNEKEYFNSNRIRFNKVAKQIKQKYKNKITGNLTLFELHAIIKGLKLATKIIKNNNKIDKLQIYTDNLNVIENYYDITFHPIIKGYTKALKSIIKNLEINYNIKINLRHIKSHCGVYGNRKADELAKSKY